MSTSIYLIDIISENALLCTTTSPTAHPTFNSSEKWQENLNDDAVLPQIFLERPLIEDGQVLGQGNPQSTYNLNIYFIQDKHELDSAQASIEQAFKDARELKRQFIVRLQQDPRIVKLNKYTTVEVSNFLDLNAVAIWLKIQLTVPDAATVCTS